MSWKIDPLLLERKGSGQEYARVEIRYGELSESFQGSDFGLSQEKYYSASSTIVGVLNLYFLDSLANIDWVHSIGLLEETTDTRNAA